MSKFLRCGIGTFASFALAASTLAASPTAPRDIRCADVDGQMNGLIGYIKMLATSSKPNQVRVRESLSVPVIAAASIVPVRDDLLCQKAGVLLNRALHQPDSTSRIVYMVQMGNRYWAEEKAQPSSHYIVGLVVDSSLATVLAHPGR